MISKHIICLVYLDLTLNSSRVVHRFQQVSVPKGFHVRVRMSEFVMTCRCRFLVFDTVNSPFELRNILPLLEDVDVFQLGIQLGIETSRLRLFEKEHKLDIKRQKIEVIDHWLKNSSEPSWEMLAKAVKRLGTHDQLALQLSTMDWRGPQQPEAVFSHLSSKSVWSHEHYSSSCP